MKFQDLQSKLRVISLMLPDLLSKSRNFSSWKSKRKEVQDISNLLHWQNIPEPSAKTTLSAYTAIYDLFEKVADAADRQTWVWNSYRAFESKIKAAPEQLDGNLSTLTAIMLQDCMYYVFGQYAQWREPVPEKLQLYVLENQAHMLPSLHSGITPELALKHNQNLWTAWQTILVLADDIKVQQSLMYDWLDGQITNLSISSSPLKIPDNLDMYQ